MTWIAFWGLENVKTQSSQQKIPNNGEAASGGRHHWPLGVPGSTQKQTGDERSHGATCRRIRRLVIQ